MSGRSGGGAMPLLPQTCLTRLHRSGDATPPLLPTCLPRLHRSGAVEARESDRPATTA